jgi:Response regulators consisting of a CheY-like receiver domain and a winged-helix DNA-binding domain
LLVIEDEPSLLKIITKRLKEEGYGVDSAKDGREGENYISSAEYDCIILDIMIPFQDGLTLLRKIRAKNISAPVLLLTAKDSISDRVTGLDSGADDYLVKPFSFDELLARVRAMLRRHKDKKDTVLSIGDLKMDTITRQVQRAGREIELTSKEYSILEYFLRNKNRVLTKSQIAEHVWNYDFEYNSNIVEVYVRYLRRKMDEEFKNKLIHTIRGGGYVLKDREKSEK